MSDNRRRTNRKTVKLQKKLGRVAQLAIRHNDEEAEAFLADLAAGRPTRLVLGQVVLDPTSGKWQFGDGSFTVKAGPFYHRAYTRGIIRGRGGFHRNPMATTAVRLHSYVVLDGEEIWAVLTPGQAYRAKQAVSNSSASSNVGSGYEFNRSSERRRNTIRRRELLKSLNTRKKKTNSSAIGQ